MTRAQEKNLLAPSFAKAREGREGRIVTEPLSDEHELIMDEGDSAQAAYLRGYREAAVAFWDWFDRSMILIYACDVPANVALDCFNLAHRKYRIVGKLDEVQLAEKHGLTKQAISKVMRRFQKRLRIPGDRNEDGCERMKKKRLDTLAPKERKQLK
jgi:hypothetical protein